MIKVLMLIISSKYVYFGMVFIKKSFINIIYKFREYVFKGKILWRIKVDIKNVGIWKLNNEYD